MSKKIKIISTNNMNALENEVNKFIDGKVVIDIKYQSFIVPTRYENGMITNLDIYDRAMVIYEDFL